MFELKQVIHIIDIFIYFSDITVPFMAFFFLKNLFTHEMSFDLPARTKYRSCCYIFATRFTKPMIFNPISYSLF